MLLLLPSNDIGYYTAYFVTFLKEKHSPKIVSQYSVSDINMLLL